MSTAAGSSPLTRGKHLAAFPRAGKRGLIPAHAGKTSDAIRRSCLIWAHPRSRGENPHLVSVVHMDEGSSPLTRGKHSGHRPDGRRVGLIPAHAGKTLASTSWACPARAHPRSRGENAS